MAIVKRAYEIASGRRFETLEAAIIVADKLRSTHTPEYVWRNGQVCYRINPDGSQEYVGN